MIGDTSFLLDSIDPRLTAAIGCPPWCVESPGHGTTDAEVLRWGELWRLHTSGTRVLLPRSTYGSSVTARLSSFGSINLTAGDVLRREPTSIMVEGVPDCGITPAEARTLAAGLVGLAGEVDGR